MPAVRVRVDKYLDRRDWGDAPGPPQAGEVVARVRALPDPDTDDLREPLRTEAPAQLLIPVGQSEYETVTLRPGRYLIQAFLPSGEVVSEAVLVGDDQEPVEVVLRGLYSPHEWLSWQHLVGNIGLTEQAMDWSRRTVPESRAQSWQLSVLATPTAPGAREPVAQALDELLVHRRPEVPLSGAVPQAWLQVAPAALSDWDGPYRSYVFGPESPAYQAGAERRYFLVQDHGQPVLLGALPLPWTQVRGGWRQAEVEVLLSLPPEPQGVAGAAPVTASAIVRDETLATVIGYLGTGDLPAADATLSRARSMLFTKTDNPIAAAAGGYVLLGSWRGQPGDPDPYWFGWIKNLQNRFSWLPDGAIQHGWRKLRTQAGPADVEEARASFLKAHRRGVPFYSAGVRLLHDGLTLLSNDARAAERTDAAVESALASSRAIALRTDVRQAFTTIRLR
jgi:hypothetical protein